MHRPVLVAIMGAQDVVDAGLRGILGTQPDIEVVDVYPTFGIIPDVIIYDSMAMEVDDGVELFTVIKEQESAVLVLGRDLRPDLAARALAHGADGLISLEADSRDIHAVIRSAATGELEDADLDTRASVLGADVGLTHRQTQVLSEVTRGLRNDEISELLGLSSNTIKSYIRAAYRKIEVEDRSQAVAWCLTHGFEPPHTSA